MTDSTGGQEGQLKRLISSCRCQFCRNRFSDERVRVTARYDDVWLLGVRCTRCRRSQAFWVALTNDGTIPTSDLTEEEVAVAEEKPVISLDDVLDAHLFLDEFDGDFKSLFRPKGPYG